MTNAERISSYPSASIIQHSSLPGRESRDLMTSYPQQQIQLTPVEQPAAGRLQKSVFDTVAKPALIRTSLLEDRKDKAMQRRSFPAHIFDKISSIGNLMFKLQYLFKSCYKTDYTLFSVDTLFSVIFYFCRKMPKKG